MRYLASKRSLVAKERGYGSSDYLLLDLAGHHKGLANQDLIDVLVLCDGRTNEEDVLTALQGKHPSQEVRETAVATIAYLTTNGLVEELDVVSPRSLCIKSQRSPPLDIAYLELTRACNLRCLHCYNDAGTSLQNELRADEWRAVIEALDDAGVVELVVTGGEPFVRADVFSILGYATQRRMRLALFTNSTLLNQETIRELADLHPAFVAVSLDGACAATHNRIRQTDCFARTIENIAELVTQGLVVRVNVTVFPDTLAEVGAIFQLAAELGVQQVIAGSVMHCGRAMPTDRSLEADMAGAIMRARDELNLNPSENPKLCFGQAPDATDGIESPCGVGCYALTIRANGDCVPCALLGSFVLGNIRTDSLSDVWVDAPVLQELRNTRLDQIATCTDCVSRSRCRGGCKARAYMRHKSFRAPDDWSCLFYRPQLAR